MVTYLQLMKSGRQKKVKKIKKPVLAQCPQKRAYCVKLFIMKPKKPNSARRRVVKLKLNRSNRFFVGYIPGNIHTLQEYSNVMVRGGRVRDLPGIRYKLIRGLLDFEPLKERRKGRSKYGTKWWWRPKPPARILRVTLKLERFRKIYNQYLFFQKFVFVTTESDFRLEFKGKKVIRQYTLTKKGRIKIKY